jgi:hypothetical protein
MGIVIFIWQKYMHIYMTQYVNSEILIDHSFYSLGNKFIKDNSVASYTQYLKLKFMALLF